VAWSGFTPNERGAPGDPAVTKKKKKNNDLEPVHDTCIQVAGKGAEGEKRSMEKDSGS